MLLSPLIPLLEAVPGLGGRVEVCARYADAIAQTKSGQYYAWLCEMRGDGGPNAVATGPGSTKVVTRQPRRQRFSVLTMVSNSSDSTGKKALELSEVLRRDVHDAIIGVLVREDYEPVLYERDVIVDRLEGRLYWADEFIIQHHVRSKRP